MSMVPIALHQAMATIDVGRCRSMGRPAACRYLSLSKTRPARVDDDPLLAKVVALLV